MVDKIRVGVIGASWFTENFHLPALASHPHAAVTAICGRGSERAHALAGRFHIPRVFSDYQALIERGDNVSSTKSNITGVSSQDSKNRISAISASSALLAL